MTAVAGDLFSMERRHTAAVTIAPRAAHHIDTADAAPEHHIEPAHAPDQDHEQATAPATAPRQPLTESQQKLVAKHMKLAKSMARGAWRLHTLRYGNHPGALGDGRGILLYDDFLSAASMGLMQAAGAYNPEFRNEAGESRTFGVYSKRYIHGELSDLMKRHRRREPPATLPAPTQSKRMVGGQPVIGDPDADMVAWDLTQLPDGSYPDGDPGEVAPLELAKVRDAIQLATTAGPAVFWPVGQVADALMAGTAAVGGLAAALQLPKREVRAAVSHLRRHLSPWQRGPVGALDQIEAAIRREDWAAVDAVLTNWGEISASIEAELQALDLTLAIEKHLTTRDAFVDRVADALAERFGDDEMDRRMIGRWGAWGA